MKQPNLVVGGTPLLPPSYLTVYIIIFFICLCITYIYFYRKKRPALLRQKIKELIIVAFLLKVTFIAGALILIGYWLVPTPSIRRTINAANKIEIVFDRPVARLQMEKSISPEVAGRWVFEDSIYTTHLYRKLVFYPTFSFRPGTTYTIKLGNIQNLIKISPPYDYEFQFKTQEKPEITDVFPKNEQSMVPTNSDIKITLNNPNDNVSEFNFSFDPVTLVDVSLDKLKKIYTLTPKLGLTQGIKYKLKITSSSLILNLEDGSVFERGEEEEYTTTFTTLEAPGIKTFTPNQNGVATNTEIVVEFSQNMDKKSVQDNFSINPDVTGNFTWKNDSTLVFKPSKLLGDTEYSVTLKKGTHSQDAGQFEQDIVKTFRTIGPVRVISFNPQNGITAINSHSPIKVTFDQEVDHTAAESKFSITPEINGNFSWENNTLVFTPISNLAFSTKYVVAIESGVKSIGGINSQEKFQTEFTTQNTSTKLSVPAYLQKYTLSCEIAALRMALNFRGLNLSEDDLIPILGTDSTPHSGNVWGNPNNAFVGNIRGTQMVDGYGTHWGPIARAARTYRAAQEFQGWSVQELTSAIINNNPVIIWVYSHFGTPTSWKTAEGADIYAVRDEHAVVAVGFVGPKDNPTQIIINDPLYGQIYWSRASFDSKWNIFGRSGVVIY